jgi:hypothetical protein
MSIETRGEAGRVASRLYEKPYPATVYTIAAVLGAIRRDASRLTDEPTA